jgi:hypothetical protein
MAVSEHGLAGGFKYILMASDVRAHQARQHITRASCGQQSIA